MGDWAGGPLSVKRSAGVAPEVNPKERIKYTSLPKGLVRLPSLDLKPKGDVTRNDTSYLHKVLSLATLNLIISFNILLEGMTTS